MISRSVMEGAKMRSVFGEIVYSANEVYRMIYILTRPRVEGMEMWCPAKILRYLNQTINEALTKELMAHRS